MIVKIEFDSNKDLVLLFGDTPYKKWHKYFREFCQKFNRNLPARAHRVVTSEMEWEQTIKGHFNKWMTEDQYRTEYRGDYSDVVFYEIANVTEKVNHILFNTVFKKEN